MAFLDRPTFTRFRARLDAGAAPPDLVVESRGNITVGYAPFHYVNERAQILIVGITPGAYQTKIAVEECSTALREGASPITACRRAKYKASFAGVMRKNLVAMLDDLGVARRLQLD